MIPVLSAFLGLVFVVTCAEFLRHTRWLDRAALLVFVALSVATRPDLGHHRTAVVNSVRSAKAHRAMLGICDRNFATVRVAGRLEYVDLFLLSFTVYDGDVAGVGLFGRVFVTDGVANCR